MEERFKTLLIFTSGLLISLVSLGVYRHQTVSTICNRFTTDQLPGAAGTSCPGLIHTIGLTVLNPFFLLASLFFAAIAALTYSYRGDLKEKFS